MQIFDYLNKEGLLHLIRKIMGRDVDLTQAEYDALPESKNSDGKNYYIYDSDIAVTAEEVGFDGSASGSTAANSQQALDELFAADKKMNESLENVNSNFNNFGTWNPTVEHGTITGSSCQYYKIGKLVTLFCAIWGGGDGTDNEVTLSLPFPSISIRAYGSVGFFPGAINYPNLHVVIGEGGNLIFEYSDGDNIKHINGKQWGTCQFSITYLAN